MTQKERIDLNAATIQRLIGSITIIMDEHRATITINGEEHEIVEYNVGPAVEAYLQGIINGYAFGLKWAVVSIKA